MVNLNYHPEIREINEVSSSKMGLGFADSRINSLVAAFVTA
jgi:hypothetical protein